MASQTIASKELADLLGVLGHRHRVRIIAELFQGELDVQTLSDILQIAPSGVSQHLTRLRAHRIVVENRRGRHVFYRLSEPSMAQWLVGGLHYIQPGGDWDSVVQMAMEQWGTATVAKGIDEPDGGLVQ